MATTGNGTTVVFGTQGWSGSILRVGGLERSRAKLDTSHLGTTDDMTSCPAALDDIGEIEVSVLYAAATGLPTLVAAETVTITLPVETSGNTAANIAGTAYVTKHKYPDLVNGALNEATFSIQYDGGTGPTYTAEVTP